MALLRTLPLAAVIGLALAAPAAAADQTVDVVDFEFNPPTVQIDPGDTVTWTFTGPTDHTATSSRSERFVRFDSDLKGPGQTYQRTFDEPGRFNYICTPHPFMRGVVQVGADTVSRTLSSRGVRGGRRSVKYSVRVLEDAVYTWKLRGPARRTVKGTLRTGNRSISVRRLPPGRYRGVFTAVDAFDKKLTTRQSFSVRG
jgi:plastocyanin